MEVISVGENRDGGCAAGFVLARCCGRVKIGCENAFAGGRFFDFCDDGGLSGAQSACEIAVRLGLRHRLQFGDRITRFGKLLLFANNDPAQDVRYGGSQFYSLPSHRIPTRMSRGEPMVGVGVKPV